LGGEGAGAGAGAAALPVPTSGDLAVTASVSTGLPSASAWPVGKRAALTAASGKRRRGDWDGMAGMVVVGQRGGEREGEQRRSNGMRV
jgi:hypothetical protein